MEHHIGLSCDTPVHGVSDGLGKSKELSSKRHRWDREFPSLCRGSINRSAGAKEAQSISLKIWRGRGLTAGSKESAHRAALRWFSEGCLKDGNLFHTETFVNAAENKKLLKHQIWTLLCLWRFLSKVFTSLNFSFISSEWDDRSDEANQSGSARTLGYKWQIY